MREFPNSGSHLVEVVRRYSRQPHLWRTSKRLAKLLTETNLARPPEPDRPAPQVHKLRQRLSKEQVKQLVQDYETGMSSTELRARYRLGKGSVLKLLAESGIPMRRRSLEPEQLAEIVRRYEAGLTIREVAAELGLPKTTVQDALAHAGTTRRAASRRR